VASIELPADCSFVTYGDSAWAEAYRPAVGVVTLDMYTVAATMTIDGIRQLTGDATLPAGEPPVPARFLGRESVGRAPP
jgi:DNA-binding LacI/PurR family transcriptional regulator